MTYIAKDPRPEDFELPGGYIPPARAGRPEVVRRVRQLEDQVQFLKQRVSFLALELNRLKTGKCQL